MSVLLQAVGILISLANAVWLAARLLAPHDMTRVEAVRIFLPAALIGIILAWTGRRMSRRGLDRITKHRSSQQSVGGDSGKAAADGGPTGAPQR